MAAGRPTMMVKTEGRCMMFRDESGVLAVGDKSKREEMYAYI
jgi:hypothetical protein